MRSRETSTSTERGALLGFEREQTWRSRENLIGGGWGELARQLGENIARFRRGGAVDQRETTRQSREISPRE